MLDNVINYLQNGLETVDYEPLELQDNYDYSPTKLYCLEPKGIGTSSVESLTSYIIRLSEAHNVQLGRLISMFEPYLQSNYLDLFLGKGNYTATYYINSSNHIAQDFVNACETLTGNNNLGQLTLTNWSGIRKRDLIKEKRAWCPVCLQEMRERKQLYEPLIWNVKLINICFKHKVLLEQSCPHCRFKGNVLHSFSRVGHCPKCKMFPGSSEGSVAKINEFDLPWESWKYNVVEEMINCNDKLHNILTPTNITQLIRNMVQHIADGNQSEFARRLNLSLAMTNQWCRGCHIPELERLLGFSFYYRVSLVTLLSNFPWQQNQFNTKALQYIIRKKQDVVNPQQVREVLREIIDRNDNPPLSLAQVIKEVPYIESVLYYNAREECKLITAKYREYIHKQKIIRLERNYKEIKMAILFLLEHDLPVTNGQIRKLLRNKMYYKEYNELRDRIFNELNIVPLSL